MNSSMAGRRRACCNRPRADFSFAASGIVFQGLHEAFGSASNRRLHTAIRSEIASLDHYSQCGANMITAGPPRSATILSRQSMRRKNAHVARIASDDK